MIETWDKTPARFKARIIGKLLGDGCITKQKARKPRFQFIHTARDYSWNFHCYHMLKDYIPLNPPQYKKVADPRLKGGLSYSHYTQSKTDEIITFLRDAWYSHSTKCILFQLLENYFTTETLAWWYLDDEHLKQSENKPQKIILSTESFTNDEINKLIHFIWKMYSLTFRIDKQNRMILYDQFQIHYFLYLVTPFLHESMVRKTIDKCTIDFIVQPKRTTIYLPKTIKLTKPTREINKLLESLDYIIGQIRDGNFYTKYLQKSMYLQNNTTSYQIVITQGNLKRLYLIKEITGLSISASVELAFSV